MLNQVDPHWKQHTALSKAELCARLRLGLPEETVVRIDPVDASRYLFSIFNHHNGEHQFTLNGSIRFDEAKLHFSNALARRAGTGVMRSINRNIHAVLPALNLNHLSLTADEVGSYLWAKAGFTPDAAKWADGELQSLIGQRFQFMAKHAPDRVAQDISHALRQPNPKAYWIVADQRTYIGAYTLGQLLTRDLFWPGHCNLQDPDCAARYRAFINGHTPAPVNLTAPRAA
jgi:hypothetical protein